MKSSRSYLLATAALCTLGFAQTASAQSSGVTAEVHCGTLTITGTEGADKLVVTQVGEESWSITGSGKTTINGSKSVVMEGVYRSIKANLGGGNDTLSIHDGTIPNKLCIDLGEGNDTLSLVNLTIGGEVEGLTGRSTLGNEGSSSSYGTFTVNGDSGNDNIYLNNVQANGWGSQPAVASTTTDISRGSTVSGDDGNNQITILNFDITSLQVNGGFNKDNIVVQAGTVSWFGLDSDGRSLINDRTPIRKFGTDNVKINGVQAGEFDINMGDGKNNFLTVNACSVGEAYFSCFGSGGTLSGMLNTFGWSGQKGFSHVSVNGLNNIK